MMPADTPEAKALELLRRGTPGPWDHDGLSVWAKVKQGSELSLVCIAGHLRGMNRWKEAKRVQAASYAMYPKGQILPQPMIPRTHHG